MKRRIGIFLVLCIIASLIVFLVPSNSYAICNTVTFTKEVTAVQLTLADGSIFSNMSIDRNINTQPTLLPNNFKSLKLMFVLDTENGIEQNKLSIADFIEKIYGLYENNTSKIQMGITGFKDFSSEELIDRSYIPSIEYNTLKNSKQDILNEVYYLNESSYTLTEALAIAQENVTNNNGERNDELLQYIVLITDGIDNEEIAASSNVILRDMSDNMVAMYGLLIGTSQNENSSMQKIFDRVYEMTVADYISYSNVKYQLENSVYDYISQFVVKTSTLMPSGGDRNTLLTPDKIIITIDAELVHGATLEIEYKMTASRLAYYGSGQIYSNRITDHKDPQLVFNKDARLLTDSSKTNASYGWQMSGDDLVTNSTETETKLLLSIVLTPQQLKGDCVYRNSASCATSFEVGAGTSASYNLTARSLDVQILPPFGEEELNTIDTNVIIYVMTGLTTIMVLGTVFVVTKLKKKK